MADDISSDDLTLKALQDTLTAYTSILTEQSKYESAAKTKLATDQSKYNSLSTDPGMLALDGKRSYLKKYNQWNVKDKSGNYYFVTDGGVIWSGADATQEFNAVNSALNNWDNQKLSLASAIQQDQIDLDAFDNPNTGTLTVAQNHVTAAQKAISDYVPTTKAGQANAVIVSNNAANISANNATAAQSNAQAAQQNAQAAKQAADTQSNIATSDTQFYIAIGFFLLIISVVTIFIFRSKNKKTKTAAA